MELLLSGLFIFTMRVIDMSMDTLRMIFVIRGRKIESGVIGTMQAAVFILAVGAALSRPLNVYTILGYSLGFGTGIILGMVIEQSMALGYSMMRIFSARKGKAIAGALREAGHAATQIKGEGKGGSVSVVDTIALRKNIVNIRKIVEGIDPDAFITLEEVNSLRRGFFRH